MKRLCSGVIGLLLAMAVAAPAVGVTPSVDTGGMNFGPGDTHVLRIGLSNEGEEPQTVDLYLVFILPGGPVVCWNVLSPGGLSPNLASTLGDCVPLARNIVFPAGLATGLVPVFAFTFGGGEPVGIYQWYLVATDTGTGLSPAGIVGVGWGGFFRSSFPVASVLGSWVGSWTNNTFATSGPLLVEFSETGPGEVSVTMDLGGGVLGQGDPPPFTVQGTGQPNGDILFSYSSELGSARVQAFDGGTIQGEWLMSLPGFQSMEMIGTFAVEDGVVGGDYTVNFAGGGNARGTFSATKP